MFVYTIYKQTSKWCYLTWAIYVLVRFYLKKNHGSVILQYNNTQAQNMSFNPAPYVRGTIAPNVQ